MNTAVESCFPIEESVARVAFNERVNTEYFHMGIEASAAMLDAEPGQFFHLACPVGRDDAPLLRRPMSVYRVNRARGLVEFLYKVTGAGTRALSRLSAGDSLDLFGPLGRGFTLEAQVRHVLMVARGVGMATMAPLAEAAIKQGARATAILSARSADLVMSRDYLDSVGTRTIVVLDTDGTSATAHVEEIVRSLHSEMAVDKLATCGSNRLLQLAKGLGASLGIGGEVAVEQLMGCGIGMCFCCVRPFKSGTGKVTYRRVCCEGPVFDILETIAW